MSGGNNWFKRLFIKAEPHGMLLHSNGTAELTRLRDGKVITTIHSIAQMQ
jgi:hypothetical protein